MNENKLRRVRQAVFAAPWAIEPNKLEAVAEVVERRIVGGHRLDPEEAKALAGPKREGAPAVGGVAVLPLYGIVGHRLNQVDDISGPGGTSTEQFGQWFQAALADPAVGTIVIDVDSPGGTVTGVAELATMIYDARGQKPIIAIANSMAASAAYWIASAADELWVTPSGVVGSIGVYAMHEDLSEMEKRVGVATTLISAGKYKTEGHPHGPLDDEARSAMQERVDEIYAEFLSAVARHRDISAEDVESGYGQGRVLSARRAFRAGMVDRVGSFDTLIKKLTKGARSASKASSRATALPPTAAATGAICGYGYGSGSSDATDGGAMGGAIGPVFIHPAKADTAKETPMEPDETPVAVATPNKPAAEAGELARIKGLRALAREENALERLDDWIERGISAEAAGRELLAALKAEHDQRPSISTVVRPLAGGENGTLKGPFGSLGQQLVAVVQAGMPGGRIDQKLHRVAEMAGPTGGSTGVGSDGGFLVQSDFATDLAQESQESNEIISRCSNTEISANSDSLEVVYIKESSRTTGNRWGGVRVYRRAEADTVLPSKAELDIWELRLEDLMAITYLTDRQMRDAAAMESVQREAFRREFGYVAGNEIFRGNGVGECLGVFNSGALVSVPKVSGQTAGTAVAQNIVDMWSRMHPRFRANSAWFVNSELEPQLHTMKIGTGTSAQLVYMPPGGLSGAPYGTIYGRPVIVVEQASAPGLVGDISLLDLSQYKTITKGGIEEAESMHVRFVYGERCLRWTRAFNGAPKLKEAITPANGTNTQSAFVALEARS